MEKILYKILGASENYYTKLALTYQKLQPFFTIYRKLITNI
jgi:hypothetical protein